MVIIYFGYLRVKKFEGHISTIRGTGKFHLEGNFRNRKLFIPHCHPKRER